MDDYQKIMEGLYNAIVKTAADSFDKKFREEIELFDKMPPMYWEKMLEYTDEQQNILIDMI